MKMIGSERALERICRVWPSSATCVLHMATGVSRLRFEQQGIRWLEPSLFQRLSRSSTAQARLSSNSNRSNSHHHDSRRRNGRRLRVEARQNLQDPLRGHGVDFIDQLNYQFTGGLMTIFIVIIGLRQYVGQVSELLEKPKAGPSVARGVLKILPSFNTKPASITRLES
uniref:Autophagy-related protein n=1 Tax=Macrostomum lignano TaxID=282301 RepID=A0A1I8FND1_9PLAT